MENLSTNVKATTIRIHVETVERLKKYRTHPRETIDDLINNVISLQEGASVSLPKGTNSATN
jgi:predicted DNA-binding protein